MLHMTDEQRYSAVLKELGEVLQDKNTTICCQKWQIEELEAKLEAAEKERDKMLEKLGDAGIEIAVLRDEIEQLKGGAA